MRCGEVTSCLVSSPLDFVSFGFRAYDVRTAATAFRYPQNRASIDLTEVRECFRNECMVVLAAALLEDELRVTSGRVSQLVRSIRRGLEDDLCYQNWIGAVRHHSAPIKLKKDRRKEYFRILCFALVKNGSSKPET